MHLFTDRQGRDWEVEITVATVKRVQDLLKYSLYGLLQDEARPLGDLVADPVRLVDTLYVVCRPQAVRLQVSDEDFGRLFAGDVLERATDAFLAELVDFFPQARARGALAQILDKGRKLQTILFDRAERELAEVDLEKAADSLLEKWKSSSGNAPDNWDLTRVA